MCTAPRATTSAAVAASRGSNGRRPGPRRNATRPSTVPRAVSGATIIEWPASSGPSDGTPRSRAMSGASAGSTTGTSTGSPRRGTISSDGSVSSSPSGSALSHEPGRSWWAMATRRTSTVSPGLSSSGGSVSEKSWSTTRTAAKSANRGTVTAHSSRAVVCRSRVDPTTAPVSRSSASCSSSAVPVAGITGSGSVEVVLSASDGVNGVTKGPRAVSGPGRAGARAG